MKRVLFVCSGNTCRSPLAEGIAKKVFLQKSNAVFDFFSAGSSAIEGFPASGPATEVAGNHGIDLSNHRSKLLNQARIKEADLIVTMGARHRETVGAIDPSALDYTYLITEFCEDVDGGIPDPIGGGMEEYHKTFDVLRKCIEGMVNQLDDFDGWKR